MTKVLAHSTNTTLYLIKHSANTHLYYVLTLLILGLKHPNLSSWQCLILTYKRYVDVPNILSFDGSLTVLFILERSIVCILNCVDCVHQYHILHFTKSNLLLIIYAMFHFYFIRNYWWDEMVVMAKCIRNQKGSNEMAHVSFNLETWWKKRIQIWRNICSVWRFPPHICAVYVLCIRC